MFLFYRGARIRTADLTDPNGARYQAAPRPEKDGQYDKSAVARRSRGRGIVRDALFRRDGPARRPIYPAAATAV